MSSLTKKIKNTSLDNINNENTLSCQSIIYIKPIAAFEAISK